MIVHQTSHKPRLWQQKPSPQVCVYHVKKSQIFLIETNAWPRKKKKNPSPFTGCCFHWTVEDLRVHYSEAPNAYWCDQRCVIPTAAPTLDTSPHTRREACHGWRKARGENKSERWVCTAATDIPKKKRKKLRPKSMLDRNHEGFEDVVCFYYRNISMHTDMSEYIYYL